MIESKVNGIVNSNSDVDTIFNNKIHFWGRITIAVGFFLSLTIPMYLTFIEGNSVDFKVLINALIFVSSFVGILWVIEPVSYFPILGSAGTYMSFLSGNIGNMRMPAVGAVQNALELKSDSKESEIASIFALVSSVIVNLAILLVVILSGQAIVSALPASVLNSFVYAVPGIFGAMTVSFALKMKKNHTFMMIIVGIIVMLLISYIKNNFPTVGNALSMGQIGIAAIIAIIVAFITAKKE